MRAKMDKTDMKIIGLLQKDGRMPSSEMAKQTGVSEATIRYRLKKLIDGKFIQIVAVGNPFKLGFGIAANISLSTESDRIEEIVTELKKLDRLSYIAQMIGERTIELETFVESIDEMHQLLTQIEAIKGITHIETSLIRRIIRERYDWGVPGV